MSLRCCCLVDFVLVAAAAFFPCEAYHDSPSSSAFVFAFASSSSWSECDADEDEDGDEEDEALNVVVEPSEAAAVNALSAVHGTEST